MKIFYSWQLWSPPKTNRYFIEEAIKKAIAQVGKNLEIEMELDRDTKGLPGTPAIADSIFAKIEQCDLFLCDLTFVTPKTARKRIPNPNVLLELGYAVSKLGWERIILVINNEYGDPRKLPFDFQHRRWPIQYKFKEGDPRAENIKTLADAIYEAIKAIVEDIEPHPTDVTQNVEQLLIDGGSRYEVKKLMDEQIRNYHETFYSDEFTQELKTLLENSQFSFLQQWEKCIALYFEAGKSCFDAFGSLCWNGGEYESRYVAEAMKRWLNAPDNINPRPIPNLLLMYIVGIIALHQEKWAYLATIFSDGKPRANRDANPATLFDTTIYNTVVDFERGKRRQVVLPARPYIGEYIQATIAPTLNQHLYVTEEYNEAFDLFEAVLATSYLFQTDATMKDGLLLPQVAYNSFNQHRSFDFVNRFWENGGKQKDQWGLLKTGLFEGKSQTLLQTLKQLERKANNISSKLDYPLDVPTYATAYETGSN